MTRTAIATMLLLGLGLPLTVSGCEQTIIVDSLKDLSVTFTDLAMPSDLATPSDPTDPGIPPGPLIGMLLDRIGRPLINTALTNPFGLVPGLTPDTVKNQYNAATPGG